eukprot:2884782-Lingulodinium_polyedra.AAC.1
MGPSTRTGPIRWIGPGGQLQTSQETQPSLESQRSVEDFRSSETSIIHCWAAEAARPLGGQSHGATAGTSRNRA